MLAAAHRHNSANTYSQANDAENVYFNAILNGPSATSPTDGIAAIFDVTRTQPIISKPSDYYVSIIRMTLPLNSMPIFICPITIQPNTTPWVVGIDYNGVYYSQIVMWQTELYTTPQSNLFADWYHFCFSYGTFVSMINVAMAAAYAAFRAANPLAPQAVPNQAPFLIYNSTTELFSWVWHQSWASLPPAVYPPAAGVARVGLNYPLLAVFDGFRTLLVNGSSPDPEDEANYVFEDTGDNIYAALPNTKFTVQGFDAISLLANLRRIVVTTSSLPIVSESVPGNNSTAGLDSQSNTASTLPILTDFVPQLDFSNDVRSIVYYTPTAQYRLTNMVSDLPLSRVQLSFWWQATDGTLVPIIIARNQQVGVKLAFFKKSLYTKPMTPR
jgi:hypothetical protein